MHAKRTSLIVFVGRRVSHAKHDVFVPRPSKDSDGFCSFDAHFRTQTKTLCTLYGTRPENIRNKSVRVGGACPARPRFPIAGKMYTRTLSVLVTRARCRPARRSAAKRLRSRTDFYCFVLALFIHYTRRFTYARSRVSSPRNDKLPDRIRNVQRAPALALSVFFVPRDRQEVCPRPSSYSCAASYVAHGRYSHRIIHVYTAKEFPPTFSARESHPKCPFKRHRRYTRIQRERDARRPFPARHPRPGRAR